MHKTFLPEKKKSNYKMLFRKLEEMKEDVTVSHKWLNIAEISILLSRFVGQIKSKLKKSLHI